MPLPVSGAFHTPFMTAARNRLRMAIADGRSSRHRGARSSPTSTPSRTTRARSGPACCRPSCRRRCAGSTACRSSRTSASPTSSSSGPGGVLTGMAKRTVDERPDDLRRHARGPRQAPRVGARRTRPTGPAAARGRAPLRPASGSSSARAPAIFAPRRRRRRRRSTIEVGTVLGHVGEREVRSPFAGILQSYIAVATERVTARQPIAWLRTQLKGEPHACRPSRCPRRRDHRVGHRPAAQDADQRGPRRHGPGHERRVDRRAHRHP